MSETVKLLLLTVLCLIQTNFTISIKVLGVFPYQGKSHFFVFKPFLQELAKRGHDVTVITHFPEANSLYKEISLAGTAKPIEGIIPAERSYKTILALGTYFVQTGTDNCEALLSHKDVKKLWETKEKFDVAIVELFNTDCGLALAYKLETPVININSHVLMPSHYDRFGIPKNPSYVPFHFLSGGSRPTLYQRLETILFDAYFTFVFKYIVGFYNEKTIVKYLGDVPPMRDLAYDVKLLLAYHNFVLTGTRLFPSNVIEVGGYHVAAPKDLPEDLARYIEEEKNGVIFVSFGSVVKASTLDEDKVRAIVDVLRLLPQKVLWKWDAKTLPGDPENIRVQEWLPQNDILAHPNVKAFISHGGLLSTTEALHHGVPMLVVPFNGDQPHNAAMVEESGLGKRLELDDLTKDTFSVSLKQVLTAEFKNNVMELSRMWHDRPLSPMDTAIFWTEFVARHKNATFRARAAEVPFYQYLFLDLIAILISVFLIARQICQKLSCRSKRVVKKEKKKRS